MITIFNRRELYVTSSMKEQVQIRRILSQNGIAYRIYISQRGSRGGWNADTDPDFACTYSFYVAKRDYEKAVKILESNVKS